MKEQPLVVDKTLAKLIGLNEALVLQQIEYWTNIKEKADMKCNKTLNESYADGYYWTYNTIEEWTEEFPFWSYSSVRRILENLRKKNLVVTNNYNKKGYDRTLWYRVNHEKLIELDEKSNTISAKCPNEETSGFQDNKTSKPLKILISAKCPNALVQNAPMEKGKMPQPIPKTTTKTTTKISSSSKDRKCKELVSDFNNSICMLKNNTLKKFIKYCEKYDLEFIKSIIEYCENRNAKSFSYFEKTIEKYIENNITTVESLISSIQNFENSKSNKVKKENKSIKQKTSSFNNFEPRQYDYDSLEKQLLGWD